MGLTITVNVNIPALDALVAYLVSRASSQAQIDALTAQVAELTSGLHQSSSTLQSSLGQPK